MKSYLLSLSISFVCLVAVADDIPPRRSPQPSPESASIQQCTVYGYDNGRVTGTYVSYGRLSPKEVCSEALSTCTEKGRPPEDCQVTYFGRPLAEE